MAARHFRGAGDSTLLYSTLLCSTLLYYNIDAFGPRLPDASEEREIHTYIYIYIYIYTHVHIHMYEPPSAALRSARMLPRVALSMASPFFLSYKIAICLFLVDGVALFLSY